MAGGMRTPGLMNYDRSLVVSWAFRDGTPAGAVALPVMAGRTNFGTFGNIMRSACVTVKPAAWMEPSVGRLQSQPTTNRFNPFMRSCERARRRSPERTCSMNRSRPPGRSLDALRSADKPSKG